MLLGNDDAKMFASGANVLPDQHGLPDLRGARPFGPFAEGIDGARPSRPMSDPWHRGRAGSCTGGG